MDVIARHALQIAGVSRTIHGSSLRLILSCLPQQLVPLLELGDFNLFVS